MLSWGSQCKTFDDSNQNNCVGSKDDWKWNTKQNGGANKNPSLISQGVPSGEMQESRKFTAEMMGFSGSTKGESHSVDSMDQGIESLVNEQNAIFQQRDKFMWSD